MFSHEYFVVFISKQFIDARRVTIGSDISVDALFASAYTRETLADAFRKIGELTKGEKIRVVLNEEGVYMTGLVLPSDTKVTRELVLQKAEESIPEHIQKTDWDFRTLQYTQKRKKDEETLVQIAVVEKSFSERLHRALTASPLRIESAVPMSFVFANAEKVALGVSVIIEQYQEVTTFCGVEEGFVIATHTEHEVLTPERLQEFLHFLSVYKGKTAQRIILSHCAHLASDSVREISPEKCEVIVKDLDVFISAAIQEKISGRDEDVLSIDLSSATEQGFWRKFFMRHWHFSN